MDSFADQTGHYADAFVPENVAYCYEVVTRLWRLKVNSRRHFV